LLDTVQQHISIVPSYPAGKSYDVSEKENETKRGIIYKYRRTGEAAYWLYSTLIFADGECDTAEKASPGKRIVEGHGDFLQKSTTLTSIVPSLHGLLVALRHLNL
jgi:hypothetical protein